VSGARRRGVGVDGGPVAGVPTQPYGPGAICEECGHFAGRHRPGGCPGVSNHNPCRCGGMVWLGVRWPWPWLPAPEGLDAGG
jgi:hypothetical protein